MNNNIQEFFDKFKDEYIVDDIILETTELIFILESPHVQELKYGAPVSGSSGGSMTKNLFGEENKTPLGRLIKDYRDNNVELENLKKVGLMNVCQIPMQNIPYSEEDIEGLEEEFTILEKIRTSNSKNSFKNEEWNSWQDFILNDFKKRLNELEDRNYTLVPCGKFAQKFFKLANIKKEQWKVIEDVPHPSYNAWNRERYKEQIEEVKNTLKK